MTYTDEEAKTAPTAGAGQAEGDLDNDEADAIVYPRRKVQAVLSKAGTWLGDQATALARPEPLVTLVVVAAAVVFTFVQFQPSNLFRTTTISGGDTGAHVLLPWVAQHQLLANLRLSGWTSSNWDGFPAVTFYFPLPIYSAVALSWLVPYTIAFKLVTAAPMILMPVAGWLFGKMARAPFPVPAVLAAATLPFIFGTEFSIYGGNIASTLAGEFAFAWSLWFALIFLGLVMRGLQTGRYRAWAAVMFACAFMSHIDPTMFAIIGFVVLVVLHFLRTYDWRSVVWWAVPTMAVGGFLAAWWALAFFLRFPYVTDMGYQRITNFVSTLFPASDTWLFIIAAMGAVLSIARRRRLGEFLSMVAVLAVIAFRFMPQSILWNARVLPFWFLSLYMLAALAVAEAYILVAERSTRYLVTLRAAMLPGPLLVLVLALIWVGFPLRILPGEHPIGGGTYEFLGIKQASESYIPSWITWNYSGYQAGCSANDTGCAKSRWPEYQAIVTEVEKLSKTYGCGDLMWEYQSEMNDYGTPDALTMLPYWTNGCIGSMEGLYYEASATTPFHFLDQSELSLQPSNPMVGLPYPSQPNVTLGVQHLQMLGVKYYMALSPQLQQQADADPSLKLLATLGPYEVNYTSSGGSGPNGELQRYWKIYLVLNSPRVHPLANQPVVMRGLNNSSQPKYLNVMTTWYDDPSSWNVYLAATGPSSWSVVPYGTTNVPVTPEPSTTVSNIVENNASISFNVSRTGVPVVVTISYFPNWKVAGAEGPYRVSPNLMVVVPTSHHVKMWYGYTPVDYAGLVLSLLALAGLVVLVRRPQAKVGATLRTSLGHGPPIGPHDPLKTMRGWWDDAHGNETWPSGQPPGNGVPGPGAPGEQQPVLISHETGSHETGRYYPPAPLAQPPSSGQVPPPGDGAPWEPPEPWSPAEPWEPWEPPAPDNGPPAHGAPSHDLASGPEAAGPPAGSSGDEGEGQTGEV
jgi:hypothetical protein